MKTPAVTTRPASSSDADFLFQVFIHSDDSRAWLAQIDPRLVTMQFTAQHNGYAARFPQAMHEIIEIDGRAAGEVRWAELVDEVRIIDVALLPQYRRHGAATAVYDVILARARACGKPARASVARLNAVSLAFHARLGFVAEGDSDTHFFLIAMRERERVSGG